METARFNFEKGYKGISDAGKRRFHVAIVNYQRIWRWEQRVRHCQYKELSGPFYMIY